MFVFVEGLWHTGKSYFVNHVKGLSKITDDVLIPEDLRSLGTVRHSPYLVYPKAHSEVSQLFDRSPVTMKVLADDTLDIYQHELLKKEYWNQFYSEWLSVLKELNQKVVFIYFRPFYEYTSKLHEDILPYVLGYNKSNLSVDITKIDERKLMQVHEIMTQVINSLYKVLRPNFEYYQVEYRDTLEGIEVLKYLKFMPSLTARKGKHI